MDNFKKLNKYTKYILNKNELEISKKYHEDVINTISNYIDMLIFKYISYICYISVNNKSKIINDDDHNIMIVVLSNKKINNMKGGNMSSPEFLGKFEDIYNVDNIGKDLLNLDFENNIARNSISTINGGGKISMDKYDKILYNHINTIFKFHNCKCYKNIKEKLLNLIKEDINIMIINLKKMNKTLNYSNIKKICKKTI